MRHLQHNLTTTTDIRKLVHKLRTRTSEPMSTATCTIRTTYTWPQTKPTYTSRGKNRWIAAKQQPDSQHHDKTDKSKPRPLHKYHHLTTTLHLTLKMTTAQVVQTSVRVRAVFKKAVVVTITPKVINEWQSCFAHSKKLTSTHFLTIYFMFVFNHII